VRRLGVVLRLRQVFVSNPLENIWVNAFGHAVSTAIFALSLGRRLASRCRFRLQAGHVWVLIDVEDIRLDSESARISVGVGVSVSVLVGVGVGVPIACAHLGCAHAGSAHVATPGVDRPRVVAHARRGVLGLQVAVGRVRIVGVLARLGTRVRLAIGAALLQLLQVGVRVNRRHEGVRRLGVVLRLRQVFVSNP